MSARKPRALSLQMLAIRLDRIIRQCPTQGVRRGRDLARWAVVYAATGGRWCRLSALPGSEYWTVWNWLNLIEDGGRRLAIGEDRLTIIDHTGTWSVPWSEVAGDDAPPPAEPASLFDLGQQAVESPGARVTDAGTAWAAARSRDPERIGQQMFDALVVVVDAGDRGATNADVIRVLRRDRGNTSRRMTDLLAAALVEPTGEDRPGPSGRPQRVVIATPAGRRLVERERRRDAS